MDKTEGWIEILIWIQQNVVNLPLKVFDFIKDPIIIEQMLGNGKLLIAAKTGVQTTAVMLASLFFIMNILSKLKIEEKFDFTHLLKPIIVGIAFVGVTRSSYSLTNFLNALGHSLTSGFTQGISTTTTNTDWIRTMLTDKGLGEIVIVSLFIIVCFFLTGFCYVSLLGSIIGRTMNLYINYYISPMYICLLGNDKLSNIGIGFIKQYMISYLSILPIFLVLGTVSSLPKFLLEKMGNTPEIQLGVSVISALIIWKLSSQLDSLIKRLASN